MVKKMKKVLLAALAASIASAPAYADCFSAAEIADQNFVIGDISVLGTMMGCVINFPAMRDDADRAFGFHKSPPVQTALKRAKAAYMRVNKTDPDDDDYYHSIVRGAVSAGKKHSEGECRATIGGMIEMPELIVKGLVVNLVAMNATAMLKSCE